MHWTPITADVPDGEFLAWVEGRCVIACRVPAEPGSGGEPVYMDARTDALLPTPSHWMPLPEPPEPGC